MTRPATLGGNGPLRAQPGTGSVEADFLEAYKDPQTRQWLGRVQLEGGRVLEGVRFVRQGSRPAVGSQPLLPAKGERGLILFPSSARQVRLAYWFGSVDHYTFGVDTEHPDESVMVHPSGQAQITDEFGNHAWRYPNGDVVALDDGEHLPEAYYRPAGQRQATRAAFNALEASAYQRPELLERPGHSRWRYDGRKGGRFFGALLQRNEAGSPGVELWGDRDTYRWKASGHYATPQESFSAEIAGDGRAAELHAEAKFSTPGDSGQASLDLEAQGGKAKLATTTPRGQAVIELDADGKLIRLETGDLMRLIAPLIRLEAERVLAGRNAVIPVAMSDVVDRNFTKISLVLGIPMEPTASKSLFAEGVL